MSQSIVCMVLLVLAAIVLKVDCQEWSRAGNTTATYDVGCYMKHKRLLTDNIFQSFLYGLSLPICGEGGVFKALQCNIYQCYCACVDTGKIFRNLTGSVQQKEELAKLCPVRTEERESSCISPPINYPCSLAKTKYSYNAAKRSCEVAPFGCYGFETKEDCQSSCQVTRKNTLPAASYNKCSLPLDGGRACFRGREIRYRHNPATGKCESFVYKGCSGNANNHRTMWECQRDCVPQGNITANVLVDFEQQYRVVVSDWLASRYGLNKDRLNDITAEIFEELKIHANYMQRMRVPALTTTTKVPRAIRITESALDDEETERRRGSSEEICRLPPKIGICRGYFARWYFVKEDSRCIRFTYGGCLGNGNNFKTAYECSRYCKATNSPSVGRYSGVL